MSNEAAQAGPAPPRLEIRVFGGLRVRRADGSVVDAREWRTRKTADLLTLLAVHAGTPISPGALLEALWPDVPESRGRASLRTAASQIRGIVGQDCIRRDLRGLVLTGSWVDAQAFLSRANDVRRSYAAGDFAGVVATARQADALYLADLTPHDAGSEWAVSAGERLRKAYRSMLADAADASLALHRPRDAGELAERLLEFDRYDERGYRALMLGAAGLGQVERAVQAYMRCRSLLAEDLGVDPSAQTRAVYLQVLRSGPTERPPAPLVARDEQLGLLGAQIDDHLADGSPQLLVVAGVAGAGSTRLVFEALKNRRVPLVHTAGGALGEALEECRSDARGLVVEQLHDSSAEAIEALVTDLRRARLLVLATCDPAGLDAAGPLATAFASLASEGMASRVDLEPLAAAELVDLAAELLADEPAPELVLALGEQTGGLPGHAVAVLDEWVRAGRVVATNRGLALVPEGSASGRAAVRRHLVDVADRLAGDGLSVFAAASVLHEFFTVADAARVADVGTREASSALQELEELSVVSFVSGRYGVREPLLADAMLAWLRPAERRALHRRVAERVALAPQALVRHWIEAGEPGTACTVAADAAGQLLGVGRFEPARQLLRWTAGALPADEVEPVLQVRLLEVLGNCCARLGRSEESADAYARAAALVASRGLRRSTASNGGDAANGANPGDGAPVRVRRRDRSAEVVPLPTPQRGWQRGPTGVSAAPDDGGDDAPGRRSDRHDEADRGGTPYRAERRAGGPGSAAAVEARLRLAALDRTPQRQLAGLHRLTTEARVLAPSPELRAAAVVVETESQVLLGGAAGVLERLADAVSSRPKPLDLASGLSAEQLLRLARHDLGKSSGLESGSWPPGARWLGIRMLTERGKLAEARRLAGMPRSHATPCAAALDGLARAELLLALGEQEAGSAMLRHTLDLSLASGVPLMLPELSARLASVQAPTDLDAAVEHLELGEGLLGEVVFARERFAILLARAAIRAASGRPEAAAAVAGQAEDYARERELVHLVAQARGAQQRYQGVRGITSRRSTRKKAV